MWRVGQWLRLTSPSRHHFLLSVFLTFQHQAYRIHQSHHLHTDKRTFIIIYTKLKFCDHVHALTPCFQKHLKTDVIWKNSLQDCIKCSSWDIYVLSYSTIIYPVIIWENNLQHIYVHWVTALKSAWNKSRNSLLFPIVTCISELLKHEK